MLNCGAVEVGRSCSRVRGGQDSVGAELSGGLSSDDGAGEVLPGRGVGVVLYGGGGSYVPTYPGAVGSGWPIFSS